MAMKTGSLGSTPELTRGGVSGPPVPELDPTPQVVSAAVRTLSGDAMGIEATAGLLQRLGLREEEGRPLPGIVADPRKKGVEAIQSSFADWAASLVNEVMAWRAKLAVELASMRRRVEELWAHHKEGVRAHDLRLEQDREAQLARLADHDVARARRHRSIVQVER
ncbi:MAG: hypothetical protein FJY99_11410 [Candidatus Sericytochromatia bacterium]|nr:hypothetical protein [Candidatus Tanganyikabacteria bacterium]